MDSSDNLPSEGWYEDPLHAFDRRWWTGSAWTDRVRLSGKEYSSPLSIGTANAQAQAANWREAAVPASTASGPTQPKAEPVAGVESPVERARRALRGGQAPISALLASVIFIFAGLYMVAIESVSGDSVAEAFYAGMGWFSIACGLTVNAYFSRET